MQIFIFRRDLRLEDNTTLNTLSKSSSPILPIFIFDPQQINPNANPYFSNNCVQFMCECLQDLSSSISDKNGKLYIFEGSPTTILTKLSKELQIESVGCNRDYTPFSKERDNKITEWCHQNNAEFIQKEDICINPIGSIRTAANKVYQKFTPFYNKASKVPVAPPVILRKYNFCNDKIALEETELEKYYKENKEILHKGGRTCALEQLGKICDNEKYKETRDIPSIPTTEMSAYNKFGCISIREFMKKLEETVGLENGIARQLYFRDFYYNIMEYNPRLLITGEAYEEKFNKIKWDKPDKKMVDAFQNAQTGFPIIDAGIRQMLATGFMHNRVRMLVSSFWTKDLLYDWRIGEMFFANNLYDYDPSQNNAGWQTVAGTGASALDWFQVMNPWTQTQKFDPECKYIKKWIPELQKVKPSEILNWDKQWKYNRKSGYPKPIVNHSKQREIMLKRYKQALK